MFSSRGPTKDGRIKPDIVAPGTNILSARSHEAGASTLWGEYSKDYLWCGGTSMATPLASAAAVITRQFAEKLGMKPSAAMVKAMLMVSAKDLFPGQYGESSAQELKTLRPNADEGYGRVDVAGVLKLRKDLLFDQKEGVATGEDFEKEISIKTGQKLSVILVYTDAAGSPVAGKALVNDLDLALTINDQLVTLSDAVNNVEIIEKTAAFDQIVKVKVKGINVPMGINGKQPFAMAVLLN
jgi:subtilisin family serine protease